MPERWASAVGERFRIVYLGRLVEEQKRITEVARAMCEAAMRHPNLEGVIAGEGEDRARVEEILRENAPGGRVRLAGRLAREQVHELLATSRALVLLSDYEGLPISLLEAMAAGVVPICLKTRSGINEVVRTGSNGFIVEDRGESFQGVVSRLIAEPDLWRYCSANARSTIGKKFSTENCHEKWFNLLNAMLEKSRPVRYPIAIPARVPRISPKFGYYEPSLMDRMFPFAVPFRNRLGLWRRRVLRGGSAAVEVN
jgi:glycosyltransferase involved in cell wall biosynthesis